MDDHVYEQVMSYAECDLITRFQGEYSRCQKVTDCESYEEVKDLCKVLNTIAKYATGIDNVTPSSFIWEVY